MGCRWKFFYPNWPALTHTLSSFPQVFVEYKANFNFKQNTPNHHNFVSHPLSSSHLYMHDVVLALEGV